MEHESSKLDRKSEYYLWINSGGGGTGNALGRLKTSFRDKKVFLIPGSWWILRNPFLIRISTLLLCLKPRICAASITGIRSLLVDVAIFVSELIKRRIHLYYFQISSISTSDELSIRYIKYWNGISYLVSMGWGSFRGRSSTSDFFRTSLLLESIL